QTLTNRLRTNMTQLGVYRVSERGLMQQILMEQDFDTYLTLLDDYNRDTDIEVALQNFTYFSRLYYHPIRLISIGLNDCL
ncbi:MAG: hypothetical protein KAU50_04060, partial [Candidatus Marinimicrobia bacterium]|nr:hypothetical protein [Candidatus Neomarinimicrobiota bacterium]